MTAFEKYIEKLVSGLTPDEDFPKNESSWEELFEFGKKRIDEIVALKRKIYYRKIIAPAWGGVAFLVGLIVGLLVGR